MNTHRFALSCSTRALLTLLIGTSAAAQITPFTDGFEAPALDPRWAVVQQSGTVVLSPAAAWSGSQGATFTTTSTGQDKNVSLSLSSSQPTYGKVSVRVWDTGAGVSSSNYIALSVRNSATGSFADVFTFDYDSGPSNGGSYYYRPWNTSLQPINSGIVRSNAWHLWEIESTPTSFAIRIDGQVFASSAQPMPIDSIRLSVSGPSWRPAFTAHFDDFAFLPVVGTGCATGTAPVLMSTPLALGTTAQFSMSGATPNAPVVLALSLGAPVATSIGGCTLQLGPSNVLLTIAGSTSASGAWTHALPIQNVPAWLGTEFTAQALVLNNTGPMLGLGDLSTGLHMALGF